MAYETADDVNFRCFVASAENTHQVAGKYAEPVAEHMSLVSAFARSSRRLKMAIPPPLRAAISRKLYASSYLFKKPNGRN
jgi:hypothetical protein